MLQSLLTNSLELFLCFLHLALIALIQPREGAIFFEVLEVPISHEVSERELHSRCPAVVANYLFEIPLGFLNWLRCLNWLRFLNWLRWRDTIHIVLKTSDGNLPHVRRVLRVLILLIGGIYKLAELIDGRLLSLVGGSLIATLGRRLHTLAVSTWRAFLALVGGRLKGVQQLVVLDEYF